VPREWTADVSLSAGTKLGPYEILAPLGAGGMGEVYKARDTRLERTVAVKVLPPAFANDAEALSRFEREAKAVAALSHPNILAIHDIGREGSVSYCVMELLEGETLRERIASSALPPRKAVAYAEQVARGLAAAHDRGLVHRDLKPDNLFLTHDGLVKILDFGLAREIGTPLDDKETGGLTAPGVILGTIGYMSPEQVRGKAVDHRSDLFALGAVLFEMLTGKRAFQRESPVETMMAILQDDPPAAPSGRAIPPEVSAILAHCLEKSPEDRFQSARDLAFALQAAERDSGSARSAESGAVMAPAKPEASIAVLAFRNMSADREAEYFSDGMTEEIINALTGIAALRVAARTSSFAYKGKDTDVRQIGREIGVGCVLEGSVRQSGQRLRVTAQLIDVATGYHVWSERYDREMQDVFTVQDEIARAIAEKLQVQLAGAAGAPVVAPATKDLAAYDEFLKGRYDWNLRRMPSAVAHFKSAVDRDPDYAAAHLALADSYAIWGFYGGIPCWEAYARARMATESAERIAPDSAGVHLSYGIIDHYYGWDTARQERALKRAAELEPRSAQPYFWLSLCWSVADRFDEGLEAARQAVALEPHSANAQALLGWPYTGSRRFEEAVPVFEKAVALEPDAAFPRWSLGLGQRYAGAREDAVATFEKAVTATGREHTFQLGMLSACLADAGRTAEAGLILDEMNEKARRFYVPPFDLAIALAALGRREEALRAVERAYDERNGLLWARLHMPMLDSLRGEPRFAVVANRLARTAPVKRGGGW
jgi:serine/threonine-protein kinase